MSTPGTPVQPSLEALMTRYLARQAEVREMGLETHDAAEVVPYEAGPVQPIDAKLAWEEASVVLGHFVAGKGARPVKAPGGWAQLVVQSEPHVAIAFAVGNFPQLVRNFHLLLQEADLGSLRPRPGTPLAAPAFVQWAERVEPTFPQAFIALGGLRLGKHFEVARRVAERLAPQVPEEWKPAWANEVAALAWHQGRAEEALAAWRSQEATLPVRFNCAMAELFLGRPAAAGTAFEQVLADLPDDDAWHHLARLYHTLSVLRA